ncbi:hypothetical protein BDZ97DRAFT_1367492 [Flammula alnicola]|nr:hypothetical protein BDZ97DRAFT_627149 [Flammula alnicola]KAF8959970.1 hypothetical protein BDZ97DRAFT_1367492 [Flammula alnicola]
MSTSTSDPFKQFEHHPQYYISDGNLYLLVDNVLFRVHSFFFERDSAKFREILDAPVAPNQPRPGCSEAKPILIEHSSPSEFAKFLWVFYNPTYSVYTATVPEWTSILKTACEYEFVEVQHLAIRGLQSCELSTVERIRIYQLYDADPKYIVPLYIKMCMRDEAPTNEEVKHMGSETSLLIFRLRESLRSRAGNGGKSPLPAGVDEEDALDAVCDFLGVDSSRIQISVSSSTSKPDKGKGPGHTILNGKNGSTDTQKAAKSGHGNT